MFKERYNCKRELGHYAAHLLRIAMFGYLQYAFSSTRFNRIDITTVDSKKLNRSSRQVGVAHNAQPPLNLILSVASIYSSLPFMQLQSVIQISLRFSRLSQTKTQSIKLFAVN